VQLHQTARQRQADAEAAVGAIAMAWSCVNMSKIRGRSGRGNADAGIGHRDRRTWLSAAAAMLMRPPGSVYFGGVAQEIRKRLRDPREVDVDPDGTIGSCT
jgi:hypothetical protein